MKVLLTGANGYIGMRLLPVLLEEGHEVYVLVRSSFRISLPKEYVNHIHVIVGDLLNSETLKKIPENIDVAYYLVHSMAYGKEQFEKLEKECSHNFIRAMENTHVKQIVYLGGLSGDDKLSPHLKSRRVVEKIIENSKIPYTILRAGIVIGSGSASFEIIRDLVEKLPIMVAPKWVNIPTQPIAIRDVIFYLLKIVGNEKCLNQTFDIGGPDILTYKELLEKLAKIRELSRKIFTVPVLTPKLSSYWLYFVTSTNYYLAQTLVESLKCKSVCLENKIQDVIPHNCLTCDEAFRNAFLRIEQKQVLSSWKDSMTGSRLKPDLSEYIQVPEHGCLSNMQQIPFTSSAESVLQRIWKIGGETGWYYMNWAWHVRGFIDILAGGVGHSRGRTHPYEIRRGESLDFWRVLLADKNKMRLLLYAEMKLPGEAWLEFHIIPSKKGGVMIQKATFRPRGILGRLYWYVLYPFHIFIFRGMARRIAGC